MMINNPNQMEIQQITNASDDMLYMFETAFSNMKIGGKRKTRKNKRSKISKRKSRRY